MNFLTKALDWVETNKKLAAGLLIAALVLFMFTGIKTLVLVSFGAFVGYKVQGLLTNGKNKDGN